MENHATLEVGGKAFHVRLPDFQKEKESVDYIKNEYLKGEVSYQPLWEREDAKAEHVLADMENLLKLLGDIEDNADVLIPHIDRIRKKKNGDFWKKSGADVFVAENCTEYFTDFTNAWSALMIRLDVNSEDTCTLSVRHRTFTQ